MKLFVSNLSFHTTEESLKILFEKFGVVTSVRVITDRVTGRNRGFGFVDMSQETEALVAVEALNKKEIEGRALSVSIDKGRVRADNKRW